MTIDKVCPPECFGGNTTCGSQTGTCSSDSTVTCGCDADCGPQAARPDCVDPDDYWAGSTWVNFIDPFIAGYVVWPTYCPSPSGAFVE